MSVERAVELCKRITSYLSMGGLFNPEMAIHNNVRDLLIDCRDELVALTARLAALQLELEQEYEVDKVIQTQVIGMDSLITTLTAERDTLLAIFSDHEQPCTSVEQAKNIWEYVRKREQDAVAYEMAAQVAESHNLGSGFTKAQELRMIASAIRAASHNHSALIAAWKERVHKQILTELMKGWLLARVRVVDGEWEVNVIADPVSVSEL